MAHHGAPGGRASNTRTYRPSTALPATVLPFDSRTSVVREEPWLVAIVDAGAIEVAAP